MDRRKGPGMLRDAAFDFIRGAISRRGFLKILHAAGIGAAAANEMARAATDQGPGGPAAILHDATGGKVTCEHLREWGVAHVFGNTGAYEAGFLDALVDYPQIQYVLGLHEGPVMAMADGCARISGKPSFVNVHSITGAANALGMIVNAHADNSPVIVSVGFSAGSGENLGVFTETFRVESVADLYTKLAFRVSTPENLAESLRRAFSLAASPAPGPVFLGVASDVWSGQVGAARITPRRRSAADFRLAPATSDLVEAAAKLAAATNPLLVAGAELPRWGGLAELARIADRLGAMVTGDTAASRSALGFPPDHPLYLGAIRAPIEASAPIDVVLLAGASRLTLARTDQKLIPENAHIIEIGVREDHLARNYPVDQLIFADAQKSLEGIATFLDAASVNPAEVAARREANERKSAARRRSLNERLLAVTDEKPIAPERLVSELDKLIDQNAIIVTEGVSSDQFIADYLKVDAVKGGRTHLISSGGSLGWGVGAAVGAKLAAPERPVIALVGDGSFQFGLQALWTAQRQRRPVTVIIFNNRGYQANRWAIAGLKGRGAATGRFIGVNIGDPDIDHVAIARGYGAGGERIIGADRLGSAMARAKAAAAKGRSYVIDAIIAQRGAGAEAAAWRE